MNTLRLSIPLGTVLYKLASTQSHIGLWAKTPFTHESACCTALLDCGVEARLRDAGFDYLGTLSELTLDYEPPEVSLRWGWTQDNVSETDGADALFTIADSAKSTPAALYAKHIEPLQASFARDLEWKSLQWHADADSFGTWLAHAAQAAVTDGGWPADYSLGDEDGDALGDSLGWIEVYVRENDGPEHAFRQEAVANVIEHAEERRLRQEIADAHSA